jgi:hypothetical protein
MPSSSVKFNLYNTVKNADKVAANATSIHNIPASQQMLARQESKYSVANQEGTRRLEVKQKNKMKQNQIPPPNNPIKPARTYTINRVPYEPPHKPQNNPIKPARTYTPRIGGTRFNKRTRNNKKINKTRRRNKNRTRGLRR